MRTTMDLHDDLMREVKRRAGARGATVTSVVEEALRALLAREDTPQEPVTLPSFGGDGVQPGVDLADWASVRDFVDESDDARVRSALSDAAS